MQISQPNLIIPKPPKITSLEFKPPSAKIPSFPPIVVPPSNLQRPAGVKAEETKQTQPETPKLDIPILDMDILHVVRTLMKKEHSTLSSKSKSALSKVKGLLDELDLSLKT